VMKVEFTKDWCMNMANIEARAAELHEGCQMPMEQARELATSEAGPDWYARGQDWGLADALTAGQDEDWTLDDIARAFAAGARAGETAAQREVASLRVKLDACMASRDALRDWAQECRNQVLYVLAQQDNELGRAADGLGQASTGLLETNAGRRGEIERLRQLLRGAELLFAPLCKDATAWNWLDETRTVLGIGA